MAVPRCAVQCIARARRRSGSSAGPLTSSEHHAARPSMWRNRACGKRAGIPLLAGIGYNRMPREYQTGPPTGPAICALARTACLPRGKDSPAPGMRNRCTRLRPAGLTGRRWQSRQPAPMRYPSTATTQPHDLGRGGSAAIARRHAAGPASPPGAGRSAGWWNGSRRDRSIGGSAPGLASP